MGIRRSFSALSKGNGNGRVEQFPDGITVGICHWICCASAKEKRKLPM
jgi:hypothetical protein